MAYTKDTDKVYLKKLEYKIVIKLSEKPSHNILFIERLENGETVQTPIQDIEYKVKDAPYGFKIGYYSGTCGLIYNPVNEIIFTNYDVSKITDMSEMFYNCHNLTSLNLSNWDMHNVTNSEDMFSGCRSLISLNLSNSTLPSRFSITSLISDVNLTNVDTSNVTDMSSMFASCTNLTSLDLSSFDTSNI